MTLSISAGSSTMVASAQMHDDSQRLAQKMIDIEQNFAQYLVADSKSWEIEMQIRDIDQKMIKQKQDGDTSLLAQRASLEAKLNTLLQKIDTLQEQSYTLHKIPEAKMQKLEQVKNQAIQHYAASDMLNTVFIDAAEESVQIILSAPEHSDVSPDTVAPKRLPRSTGDDFQSLAGMYGIVVETKHFTPSSHSFRYLNDNLQDCNSRTKNSDCGALVAGVEICVRSSPSDCARATLGFPAVRNGDSGFVTVGHAFALADGSSGNFIGATDHNGNSTEYLNNVYQIGPSKLFNSDKSRESIGNFHTNHANQLIGTLVYGTFNSPSSGSHKSPGVGHHDAAFVQLQSGARTVLQEVVYTGTTNLSISGYSESANDRKIGKYVSKSGMRTGYTSGTIVSSYANQAFATYNVCVGDSGSPVGKRTGSSFTVYGMQVGIADDDTTTRNDAQTASCAPPNDGYSSYIPYAKIKADLSLR